ncbi:MAG: DinB family protein [Gemmatimonadetes bacterium]|nr:DinB family protein [Gemmatimonadota bacterium]
MSRARGLDAISGSIDGVEAGVSWCLALCAEPERAERARPSISAWSVAEHLEHLLLVDRAIGEWILRTIDEPASDPTSGGPAGSGPNETGARILESGTIPRGRGPAPDLALPRGVSADEIAAGFVEVGTMVGALRGRVDAVHACRAVRPHHVLGAFTPAEWLRFLHIHHDHHAAIVDDILG